MGRMGQSRRPSDCQVEEPGSRHPASAACQDCGSAKSLQRPSWRASRSILARLMSTHHRASHAHTRPRWARKEGPKHASFPGSHDRPGRSAFCAARHGRNGRRVEARDVQPRRLEHGGECGEECSEALRCRRCGRIPDGGREVMTWETHQGQTGAHDPKRENGRHSGDLQPRRARWQPRPTGLSRSRRDAAVPGRMLPRAHCLRHPGRTPECGIDRVRSRRGLKQPAAAADSRGGIMKARKKPNTRREHQQRNAPSKRRGATVAKAGRQQRTGRNVRETAGSVVKASTARGRPSG
jgi:hypothetical protein